MERPPTQSPILKFGVFEVDLASEELRKSGMRQNLSGQPFEILRVLLEQPHEVVTREELRRHLWPDNTFVDYDLALKRVINRLREALGDSADNPRFIETIPRKGYRFIAPVSPNGVERTVAESPVKDAVAGSSPFRRSRELRIVLGLGAVVTLLALGLAISRLGLSRSTPGSATQIHSLAVLPLQNLSADPAQEYFSDGMTDALITDLAQIGSLKVISRTSSMQYKQTKKSLPDIARELNVDGIIEGTVQRSGDRVRITAQLIHGPSDKHIWARSYEQDIHDVFALQRDLTQEIARGIQAQLNPTNQARLAQARPANVKALDAYLQGSYYLNRFTEEDVRKAQEFFQQAIDSDPAFAPAYAGMALAHYEHFRHSSEEAAIAKRAAQRALELDPTLSDAWLTLGKIKIESWDWPGTEEDYRKAIELNPSNASAHQELGEYLHEMGRRDEGLKECQIAQQLDPNANHLGEILESRGEFDRSIELTLIMLRKDPNNVVLHYDLYLDYEDKGMYKGAVQHLEQAWALAGFPEVAASLNRAFTVSGYTGALREYAKQLEHLHAAGKIFLPVNLAGVYAILGDKDRAFYWLEEAYQHGGSGIPLWMLKSCHALGPLQSDPRYTNLLRRMGLPS